MRSSRSARSASAKRDAAGAPTAAAAANANAAAAGAAANAAAAAAAANAAAMPATLGSGKSDDELAAEMQEEFDAINAAAAAHFADQTPTRPTNCAPGRRAPPAKGRRTLAPPPPLPPSPRLPGGVDAVLPPLPRQPAAAAAAPAAGPSNAGGGSSAAAGAASVEYVATGNQTAQMTTEAIVRSVLAAPPPTLDEEIAQKAAELRAMLVKRKRDDFDIDDFDSCMKKATTTAPSPGPPDASPTRVSSGGSRRSPSAPNSTATSELGAAARALRDLFLGATAAPSTDSPAELEKAQYRSAKTAKRRHCGRPARAPKWCSGFGGDLGGFGEESAAAEAPTASSSGHRRRATTRRRRRRTGRSSHLRLLAQARIPEERANCSAEDVKKISSTGPPRGRRQRRGPRELAREAPAAASSSSSAAWREAPVHAATAAALGLTDEKGEIRSG